MKRITLFLILSSIVINGFSQVPPTLAAIMQMDNAITALPYSSLRSDQTGSKCSAHFPIAEWSNHITPNLWSDWQLSQSMTNDDGYCSIYILFPPGFNGGYYFGVINYGPMVQGIDILFTASIENGEYISSIEGAFAFDAGNIENLVCLKQWSAGEIRGKKMVTVYHIRPQTNYLFTQTLPASFTGVRIDTYYEIDSTGHFIKKSETTYQPKTYTLQELSDENTNIWNGNETVASTQTF